tara:strand:- start:251 stop:973 length:723 start_codon:yes stop_codon:yes gene_type:complete
MKVKAFPEVFNTFGSTDIKNSKKGILNNVILETYKNELLLNKDGCIFKLVHNNLTEGLCVEDFIVCGDFTGPDGIIYLPNEIYENLLLDETNNDINIELFNPPQASKIRLKSGKPILNIISVRDEIENEIKKNHMFIRVDDVISVDNNYFIVQELEPYNICLANNTDIKLEIDEFNFEDNEMDDLKYEDDNERVNIQFDSSIKDYKNINREENITSETYTDRLSLNELRKKRLAFYSKKK